ncbi:hypothetical protein FBZ89_12432 [Nitrospirillum amazonense]|uniref:Enamine deaminase RidA (YjgF/YER057c/UK114 family) n=1 Tax=Nitrospirillum amazonense TaxID=28077 RepID=A0A560ESR8_9PROT|nr:hypothetical protein [Nitrospirillum amazonense]TWB12419.1 hypothetical protein FBZ89_12432 [Nitrospirillum amazonense]
MRNSLLLTTIFLGLACSPLAAAQQRETDATRLPLRYASPDNFPRWSASLAVVTKSWVKTADLGTITPSDTSGDLKAQLASALDALDKQLAARGARRNAIIRLNVRFVGEKLEDTRLIGDALAAYFAVRNNSMAGTVGGIDYPVRSTVGVESLEPAGAKVALQVRLVEDGDSLTRELVNPELRGRAATAPGTVLFGGVSAQQKDFTIEGYDNFEHEVTGAVKNLAKVLANASSGIGQVKTLTVYYAPHGKAEITDEVVRRNLLAALKTAGAKTVPKIEVQAVGSACTPQFQVILDGEAIAPATLAIAN